MDEIEIKSLLVRERFYRDTFQWQKLRDCYHADASLTAINISWFRGNVDGFVAGSQRMAKRRAAASHAISPAEVTIKGDKSLPVSTGSIIVRFERDGAMYNCVSWTRLQRTKDKWKMLTLEVIYERDSIIPVLPEIGPIRPFELKCSRQSYRCLAWLLAQKGYEVNEQLAGLDWPESVENFIQDQYRWLNE